MPAHRALAVDAVAHAAWNGDWRPAAAHVEEAGQNWDERWLRLELLEQVAERDDAWLNDWRAARPKDCAAATVHAQLLIHRAWVVRGSGYAYTVSADRMALFMSLLKEAMEAAEEAAQLASDDPGPWVVMITAARGLRLERDRFQQLWLELYKRAPHHYMGHWQALQYWCAKWAGSNKLMMDFAERAVHRAPAGSPLAGLYLLALEELGRRPRHAALPSSPAVPRTCWRVSRGHSTRFPTTTSACHGCAICWRTVWSKRDATTPRWNSSSGSARGAVRSPGRSTTIRWRRSTGLGPSRRHDPDGADAEAGLTSFPCCPRTDR
ncbi:hypothetical protein [Streptomyces sp. NRRL WC-3744]|uniref:hypothetical protein n=1 Tax=Streptomyces sp. NRRL WC-3744 TaxID=1463935 RepID=UPI001F263A5E|nr:hypothetical protein [Streptomyces sp. NRRL WC-3744]